jgi:hypothetical protein
MNVHRVRHDSRPLRNMLTLVAMWKSSKLPEVEAQHKEAIVPLGLTVRPHPLPHVAEHALVERQNKIPAQHY